MPLWMLLFAACVPRGAHELVEVQLDATRTALQAQTARCQAELDARDTRVAEAEAALAAEARTCTALAERTRALEADLDRWHRAEAEAAVASGAVTQPAEEIVAGLAALAELHAGRRLDAALAAEVQAAFAPLVAEGRVELAADGPITVRIPTDRLFNAGTTMLSPYGDRTVELVAAALKPGWRLRVEGHTDGTPRHSAAHPSNRELAFAQALAVWRHLDERGAPGPVAIVAWADGVPLADEATPEGKARNRRVEIVIERAR